jgi:hypothetical protein
MRSATPIARLDASHREDDEMSTETHRQRSRRVRALPSVALACALLAVGAGAVAAKSVKGPLKGAAYGGTTSERVPVTFKVSGNGKRIVSFSTSLGYDGDCGQGGGPAFEVKIPSIAIAAGGRFSATAKGTLSGAIAHVEPITVKVAGRISGAKASGTVRQPGNVCQAPHKGRLSYSETFTAGAGAL